MACAVLTLTALALAGCATNRADTGTASSRPFELNIAHINDHHSQLDGFAATELVLDGLRLMAVSVRARLPV